VKAPFSSFLKAKCEAPALVGRRAKILIRLLTPGGS
jgi:hypothetical protein